MSRFWNYMMFSYGPEFFLTNVEKQTSYAMLELIGENFMVSEVE